MEEVKKLNLTNSEWLIMEQLWDSAPQTVTQIAGAMARETGWAKSTTKTLLMRMVSKGILHVEEGEKARRYRPAVGRSEAALAQTESFLERVYQGSLGLMVNALADTRVLTSKEIGELRAILDRAENKNG